MKICNDTRQVQLRKVCDSLRIEGSALILLGIWSIAKTILSLIFGTDTQESFSQMNEAYGQNYGLVFLIILIIIMLVDLGSRFFIGMSARKEAKIEKNKYVYLIFVLLLIAIMIAELVYYFTNLTDFNSVISLVAYVFLELINLYLLVNIAISSIRIKILRKEPR